MSTHDFALHICTGSPIEDFAQIYAKVQSWEVKQNIPNGSGRDSKIRTYEETAAQIISGESKSVCRQRPEL